MFKLFKRNKWISVADSLPLEGLDVLVCVPSYNKVLVAYYYKGVWSDTVPKMGHYFIRVTHWRKLPELPYPSSLRQAGRVN